MGAREKLNSMHVGGGIIVAGAIGLLTGSWLVFLVVAGLLIAGLLHDGSIRPNRRRR